MRELEGRQAQRDAKLSSYQLSGVAAGQPFEFSFRAPNLCRGVLRGPAGRTLSFDGKALYELDPAGKKLAVFEDALGPEKSAELLAQLFSPFAPEGYRVPLFSPRQASVEKVRAPNGPEAVRIRQETSAGGGKLATSWLLRWPSLDFLERRLEQDREVVVRMDEERCDEALHLCVPTRVTTVVPGEPDEVTTVARVDLHAALPVEGFALAAPAGYVVEHHQLVEQARP